MRRQNFMGVFSEPDERVARISMNVSEFKFDGERWMIDFDRDWFWSVTRIHMKARTSLQLRLVEYEGVSLDRTCEWLHAQAR